MKLLIIEGGIHGSTRNCSVAVRIAKELSLFDETKVYHLIERQVSLDEFCNADAYLFITGTYWDSCGSPLQKFIEDFTLLDVDSRIMGKPVGFIILCHTVGGKSVLSRLQSIFSCMGFMIPPLSGMVVVRDSIVKGLADSWSLIDIKVVMDNLLLASKIKAPWSKWKVSTPEDLDKVWLVEEGYEVNEEKG